MPSGYPRRDSNQPPQRRRQRARPSGNARNLPVELKDAKRGIRLQKALADAGVAGRRDCEDIILQGRVKVNGVIVAAMPAWVDPATDRIEVDGKPMRRLTPERESTEKIYVLLNKPRRVISTTDDPDQRRTVADIVQLPPDLRRRLFPVGRLDADSNGLILMTNDGDLANRLTHPRFGVPKQYAVSIRGKLTPEDITTLKEGIHLAHLSHDAAIAPTVKRAAMAQVELLGYGSDRNNNERTRILVTLREGQNREIRRMIAHLGFKVRRLERVAIGPLSSRGLGVGQWRFLTPKELTQLHRIANKHGDGTEWTSEEAMEEAAEQGHAPRAPRVTRRRLPNNTEELRTMFGKSVSGQVQGSSVTPPNTSSSPRKVTLSANAPRPKVSRRGLPNSTEELRAMFDEQRRIEGKEPEKKKDAEKPYTPKRQVIGGNGLPQSNAGKGGSKYGKQGMNTGKGMGKNMGMGKSMGKGAIRKTGNSRPSR